MLTVDELMLMMEDGKQNGNSCRLSIREVSKRRRLPRHEVVFRSLIYCEV